ncbi:YetF domain-containing protein [Neobacillus sp. NPDC093182]|uniref:YetF domain-containing protein n=1 Tax=Neobacillus sp. NPDC093182 TaxID=3364297 RepID=UPI00380016D2
MPEYVEVAGRAIFSFLVLFSLARFLGKKQISHLTFFDYVVGIVIGDMASQIAIDTSMKIVNGLIGLVVYTFLSVFLAYGAIKSFKFRDLVESSPSILIKDGKIMEKSLFKHKMTYDDLMNGLREKDAFMIDEVEMAILETNGQISVMKKPEFQALTAKDIGLRMKADHAPSLIIIDGTLLEKRLRSLGYTKDWLLSEVKKKGADTFEDVFLAQINSNGTVYVDLYDDNGNKQ